MTHPRLSRRNLIQASGAAIAVAGTSAAPGHADPLTRPNIVWLLTEDNNPCIGAYGDEVANTPVLDRLAAQGALYEVAYSPAPVCAPSRFSYLTGVPAETCGPAHNMRAIANMPTDFRGFPEYLRWAGYYTTNNDHPGVHHRLSWIAASPSNRAGETTGLSGPVMPVPPSVMSARHRWVR
ncbi:sulfatase-like hydrolase/transferase [Aestuariimicrobium ganziense]|uniref:sulfatase-like hydrolase/transferase n=1 Tax=Aestuariimicrobium ganziense TaxID=2773677 RepID=UPI001944F5AA|nr:sulfatase-like hydrolase/transferase [Aestuariimicrobium ganziense]